MSVGVDDETQAVRDLIRNYQMALTGEPGAIVRTDLARFCYADRTTLDPSIPESQEHLEGRRQVWLRILSMMSMNPENVMPIEVEE